MQRQNIVVLIKGEKVEAWGNLKDACLAHGWITHNKDSEYDKIARHLRDKEKPIWDGWLIYRVPFREMSE